MRTRRRAVLTATAAISLVALGAPAASASGGEVGGSGAHYHMSNGWQARTDLTFSYGRADDVVYVGDWDADGVDTLAVRREATYHFSNRLSGGDADSVLTYGRADDAVLMGDWDGDGVDTPVVRRGAEYHFKNRLSGGEADAVVHYGRPDDVVVVGDWNGDGRDTLAVRRGQAYHLKNSISGGEADVVVHYGREADEVIVGDWNGDGRDTLGIRRDTTFHIKNAIAGGDADRVMTFGRSDDAVLVGDWDGSGSATIGLRTDRPGQAPQPPPDDGLVEFDAEMVELINAERAAAGVPEITAWPALRAGAIDHSSWMAATHDFEHATEDTIREDGIAAGCAATAENIFWGTSGFAEDPAAVLTEYMNSPGHRANILNPDNQFVAIGTVQADDNGRIYNTQRFAATCS